MRPTDRTRKAAMTALMALFVAGLILDVIMQGMTAALAHSVKVVGEAEHTGRWGVAILSVSVLSFFLLSYLVPSGPGRRRSMGLVQAFVVALYAEMYGFPLTVYLLALSLGLPALPGLMGPLDGHLLALAAAHFGVDLAMATALVMALSSLVMAVGFLLIYQGWSLIHRGDGELVTGGIYQRVRHPQYLGIFVVTFGLLIHWPTVITVVMWPILLITYGRLARREEEQMLLRFGVAYTDYQRRVPLFWPRPHIS